MYSKTEISDILEISEQKARQIVQKEIPYFHITDVIDYKDLYVFEGTPSLIGLISVRKIGGEINGFNPMRNDPDEYFKTVEKHKRR